jgi:transposase
MLHKSRDLTVRQRTMLINALRGHLAEYGIVTGVGSGGVTASLKALHEEQERLPAHARSALHGIAAQLSALASEIDRLEAQILAWHRNDETSRRLATIPGIGPITASAIAAAVPDASLFRSGRQFATWLGLTPRANSSGGKERLGGITKQGDGSLRRRLMHIITIRGAGRHAAPPSSRDRLSSQRLGVHLSRSQRCRPEAAACNLPANRTRSRRASVRDQTPRRSGSP